MRRPMIAGNWKMHCGLDEARRLVASLRDGLAGGEEADVLICPPAQLLFPMAKAVDGSSILLGAQNAHEEDKGAFTGEVSVPMIADTGARFVIIGHSERRHVFGESADRLARKVKSVVGHGLTCIYCLGETLDEREAERTEAVVIGQLKAAVTAEIPHDRLIIAYEPVWAIGTGRNATPEQAQAVHARIRAELAAIYGQSVADEVRILYGGSVKPGNAGDLLACGDIDGALVGGASLVAEDFLAIIRAASTATAR